MVLRSLYRALRLGAALRAYVADVIQFAGDWHDALGLHSLFAAGTSDNRQRFKRFTTDAAIPESRQRELIALLWPFPADVGKAVAVTFLQPVNRKTASWTAAIKIPDHRTVSPQSLARVPRSGSGRGDGRICEAAQAAGTSVGGSAQISGDTARSRHSRQRADRDRPEVHEARLPSPRLGRVEMPRRSSWSEGLAPHDHRPECVEFSDAT